MVCLTITQIFSLHINGKSQQLQREQPQQNYQMSTGLLEKLQIYLQTFLKATEPHQMLLE